MSAKPIINKLSLSDVEIGLTFPFSSCGDDFDLDAVVGMWSDHGHEDVSLSEEENGGVSLEFDTCLGIDSYTEAAKCINNFAEAAKGIGVICSEVLFFHPLHGKLLSICFPIEFLAPIENYCKENEEKFSTEFGGTTLTKNGDKFYFSAFGRGIMPIESPFDSKRAIDDIREQAKKVVDSINENLLMLEKHGVWWP